MKTKIIYILMLSLLVLVGGCASTKAGDQFKGMTSKQIFNGGEKALAKHHYDTAVKYFEGLEALYPFGPDTQQAQLDIIYAYYKNDDATSALSAADRYIHLYPQSSDVDYAYYMKGLVNFERGQSWIQKKFKVDPAENDLNYMHQAFVDFNELLQHFPESKYAPDAQKHMIYIRNLLAKNEIEAAQFYMRHKAYVAAVNRASFVVQHYQGAPEVVDALAIMVEANRALGLEAPANDALRVLQLNYPNSAQYRTLMKSKG